MAVPLSIGSPGVLTDDILKPSPTSCAVLDDGEIAEPGVEDPGVFRSDDQYLTRWTELSKLLSHNDDDDKKRGGKICQFVKHSLDIA